MYSPQLATARRSPPQPTAARRSPPQRVPRSARSGIGVSANGGVFHLTRRKQRDLNERRAARFGYLVIKRSLLAGGDLNLSRITKNPPCPYSKRAKEHPRIKRAHRREPGFCVISLQKTRKKKTNRYLNSNCRPFFLRFVCILHHAMFHRKSRRISLVFAGISRVAAADFEFRTLAWCIVKNVLGWRLACIHTGKAK